MKRISILLAGLFLATTVTAQSDFIKKESSGGDFKKNVVKLNLFALPMKNISLQYERGLTEHFSVCMGVRLQPKSKLPFANTLSNAFEDSEDGTVKDFFDNARAGSWGITPEVRYYFGKNPLSGFYVAPFARFGGNSLAWKYDFLMDDGTTKRIDFNGKVNQVYGGLLLGAQWHLGESVVIDWWILGPSYGSMKINLNADADLSNLTAAERADLEDSFDIEDFETKVENNGVRVNGKMPMFGLRTGLCIGYTF